MSSEQPSSPPFAHPESSGNSASEGGSCAHSRSTSVSEPDDGDVFLNKEDAFNKWRPKFHLIAPKGWLNDPCAPGYDRANDCYHIGFQWNPDTPEWGNIKWGAATSRDLLSWDVSVEPSIVPTEAEDQGGVFTGCLSPVELRPGEVTTFYTSARILPIHHTLPYNYGSEGLSLATSKNSGRTWDRHATPILPGPPTDLKVTGWRDPFVSTWPSMAKALGDSEETLYGIVSGGLLGQGPTPFIYRLDSEDITKWSFLSPLVSLPCNFSQSPRWSADHGANWEVTNFLSLQDPDDDRTHDFLIMGVEGLLATEKSRGRSDFDKDHGQLWMCGTIEAHEGQPRMKHLYGGPLDHGSYYAGNSFWDPKTNQRIIVGWIVEEDLPIELKRRQGWAGFLSVPRALKIQRLRRVTKSLVSSLEEISSIGIRQDGVQEGSDESTFEVTTLCAVPDDRLRGLRRSTNPIRSENGFIFPQGCSTLEVIVSFEISPQIQSAGLKFTFAGNNAQEATIEFDPSCERLTIRRDKSTKETGVVVVEETAPHTLFTYVEESDGNKRKQELLLLRVLFDVSVLELFANERTALTTRLYADVPRIAAIEPFIHQRDSSGSLPGTTSGALHEFTCWELGSGQ
ncbi:Acid beta-fructofuranosidase [Colletotrichum siamense]|nr:Acid beta-fructofuranosidase [Colletotrichum siamense]